METESAVATDVVMAVAMVTEAELGDVVTWSVLCCPACEGPSLSGLLSPAVAVN